MGVISLLDEEEERRKKNLMIIIPIIATVAIIMSFMAFMFGPALNSNQIVLHNHVALNVTYNHQALTIPEHIGMVQIGKAEDPLLYGDHSLDKYGMEGMSSLHKHDASGSIHVESNTKRDFKLGEFLDIWKGLDINGKTAQDTMNGNPRMGILLLTLET
jgi:hypothetical protein